MASVLENNIVVGDFILTGEGEDITTIVCTTTIMLLFEAGSRTKGRTEGHSIFGIRSASATLHFPRDGNCEPFHTVNMILKSYPFPVFLSSASGWFSLLDDTPSRRIQIWQCYSPIVSRFNGD